VCASGRPGGGPAVAPEPGIMCTRAAGTQNWQIDLGARATTSQTLTTCSTEPGGHLAVRCLAGYQAEPAHSPAMDGLGDEDVPSAGWLRVTSGDPQTSPQASRRHDEAAAFLVSLRAGP